MSLEAGIGLRLGLKGGGTLEEMKEKFPLCESIGHRPFGAAAQKSNENLRKPTNSKEVNEKLGA